MRNPQRTLANLEVDNQAGYRVGHIADVIIDDEGVISRVEIELTPTYSVWVRPENLRYFSNPHIVMTDLTRDQLWDAARAT